MKKFFKKVLLFALILGVFLTVVEVLARRVPNSYALKAQYMKQNAARVETLVLGNSHTFMGIAPEVLDPRGKAFNLANVSQPIDIDLLLLEHYGSQMPNLRRVVLPISLFSLYEVGFDQNGLFLMKYYRIYCGMPVGSLPLSLLEVSDAPKALAKIKEHYITHKDACQTTPYGQSAAYFLSNKPSVDWENAEQRAEGHRKKGALSLQAIACLDRIASFCNQRAIELVLVATPTRSAYARLADTTQLISVSEQIDRMTQTYRNVRYVDMMCDARFEGQDDLFFDADHLSDLGAIRFSRILADTLLRK